MKITKLALPLLLCSALLFTGCGSEKTAAEKIIISELDLLKNLDTDTAQKYISYTELFPDTTEAAALSPDVEDSFALFFKSFDYKILDIEVDKDKHTATADIRLTTIDANQLARDFAAAKLQKDILRTASSQPEEGTEEDNYVLLGSLLKENTYKTVENNCTMTLEENSGGWEIQRSSSLENQLVGGFPTYLASPNILPPKETVQIYLDTLKNMDDEQLAHYLGMGELTDSNGQDIAAAIADQIHRHFDYSIVDTKEKGYEATVTVDFTTFDIDAILTAHKTALDEYLASADAVIDGSDKRLARSRELLVTILQDNTATVTTQLPIMVINNGASWAIEMDDEALGKALFGNLMDSIPLAAEPVQMENPS